MIIHDSFVVIPELLVLRGGNVRQVLANALFRAQIGAVKQVRVRDVLYAQSSSQSPKSVRAFSLKHCNTQVLLRRRTSLFSGSISLIDSRYRIIVIHLLEIG